MNPFKRIFQTRKKASYSSDSSSTKPGSTTPTSVLPDVLSRSDLESLLTNLGPNSLTSKEVDQMLKEVGDDIYVFEKEELRETFQFFDKNGDGRITAEELLEVFREIDGKCVLELEDCQRMVKEVDKGGRGSVCFDDFCVMMMMEQH